MSTLCSQVNALLINDMSRIPIRAQYESRSSMHIHFTDCDPSIADDCDIQFVAYVDGKELPLGPCRIEPLSADNAGPCRLVFVDRRIDCSKIFIAHYASESQKKLSKLRELLSVATGIRNEFKQYTADLVYHLNAYRNVFGDLDAKFSHASKEIKATIQQALIESEGPRFFKFLDLKLTELKHLVEGFGPEETQKHGYYFRRHLWNFLICSPLIRRTNIKPRGFPGDSKVMQMIYSQNDSLSSTFSRLLHRHALGHAAAQSVRNRIDMVSNTIRDLPNRLPAGREEKIRILSVGCGPSLEVQNIIRCSEDFDRYQIALLDQDHMAISESSDLIKSIEEKYKRKIEVEYINSSIRTMIFSNRPRPDSAPKKYHFIYSLGLFDYLSFPIAKALLRNLYKTLKSGGYMLIGNFHVDNPSKYYMEYWCDWVLRHRTGNELIEMTKELPGADTEIFFEETGSQMFLHLLKSDAARKPDSKISKSTFSGNRIYSTPTS